MSISVEEIKKLSNLSRVLLSDDEIKKIQNNFKDILSYIDIINEVNVKDIEPMDHILIDSFFMRKDIAVEVTGDNELKNCKSIKDRLISVPKIIK